MAANGVRYPSLVITKKIFLASSAELIEDRDAFELMVGRLNKEWRARDYAFDVIRWEYFIDAMSKDGLQKEYNRAVAGSDLFVMLFFTKVGRYTLEEFETAFAGVAEGGPRIFTYFRNDSILTGDIDDSIKSLLDFKARLKALNHYVTTYRNTEDLQFQFSRQLEKLYGDDGTERMEITDRTPAARVEEIALLLTYRQLFGGGAADAQQLSRAIERTGRQVRNTIFHMASELRRETWLADKRVMQQTIPVFEALIKADDKWHRPWGQLGFALVDKPAPDWARGKACLDRAVELRGEAVEDGTLYYNYNRLRCEVELDPAAAKRAKATAETRESVIQLLRLARRDLDAFWDGVFKSPDSEPIRAWMTRNNVPRPR
jgi:hypothetical protein